MNRLSAIDSFAPAMERVTRMLFRPFRLKTWLKIGFIGLLSGGVARLNSSFNFRPPVFPSRGGGRLPEDPMAENHAGHSFHPPGELLSPDRGGADYDRGALAGLPLPVLPFSLCVV